MINPADNFRKHQQIGDTPSIHEIPTIGIRMKLVKSDDPEESKKLTEFFNATVEKIEALKFVDFKIDKKKCTLTLFHHDMEVSGILEAAGLPRNTFPRVEITENILTMTMDYRSISNFSLSHKSHLELNNAREWLIIQAEKLLASRKNLPDLTFDSKIKLEGAQSTFAETEELLYDLFKEFFEAHDGICFGEAHRHISPKHTLITMMPHFAKFGVKTLYMEHLFHDSMQSMLDAYFESVEEMPVALKAYLEKQGEGHAGPFYHPHKEMRATANYVKLVEAAKANGIRVVGIDTTLSYAIGQSSSRGVKDAAKRYIAMNATSTSIIEKRQKLPKSGKYVILLGSAHMSKIRVKHREGKVPGVATMLGIPSVLISDSDQSKVKANITSPVVATLGIKVNLDKI